MRDLMLWVFGIVFTVLVLYGMYWIFKNGSYFFFYEEMVQETIREMVRQEALK